MSRRRITHRHPVGPMAGSEMLRLGSLVLVLAVLGLMYFRARDPDTWRWLASDQRKEQPAAAPQPPVAKAAPIVETVIDGPDDTDDEQRAAFQDYADAITDNRPLATEEMFAYWQLFEWTRANSFRDLWNRADKDVLFDQLFGAPSEYRGQPVALKLHIKRVLRHPASRDDPDRPTVYEAWGATDDSKTFPYCVLFLDKPPQLPLGDDLTEEARFAGYFLKNLQYRDKLDKSRGAPLLIGRIEWQENPGKKAYEASRSNSPWEFWVAIAGFAAFLILRWYLRPRPTAVITTTAQSPTEDELSDWLNAAEKGKTSDQSPVPSDQQNPPSPPNS